jgi:hypothetical protein
MTSRAMCPLTNVKAQRPRSSLFIQKAFTSAELIRLTNGK